MPAASIESLDREGRGVAHVDGKTLFVEGALPGERVEYELIRSKPAWALARLLRVIEPSGARRSPRCAFFGACGGCSMQHLDEQTQLAAKQRVLEDALWHVGRVRAETMLRPIQGEGWGYRNRARLSVRMVPRRGGPLVGFRERKSTYVADMTSCEVLPPAVAALLLPLRELVGELSIPDRLPQIEVAVGERVTVLVLRILAPLDEADAAAVRAFAGRHGVQIWLQTEGPDSARPFWPEDAPALDYSLPEYAVRVGFLPTDFTQVNHAVNRVLVRRAIGLLEPQAGESIGDFFCGLGNFTLPIACSGARVSGYEGNAGLVERARRNAAENRLDCRFEALDLFDPAVCMQLPPFDKVLLDPPRDGAMELVKSFAGRPPGRIVYVSCDPATLARDAGVLVHTQGFRLAAAGAVNMFPHTSHMESVALFLRD